MELGRKIRELGLDTFQTRGLQCASACSLAFLGGVSRSSAANAIGVHRPYYPNGFPGDVDDAVVATQQATADMIGYLIDMGVDPALVQLSYEYTDMRYLTQDEMARYRVTTSGAPTPDVREAQTEAAVPAPEQEMPLPATAVFVPPTVRTLYVSPNGAGTVHRRAGDLLRDRTGDGGGHHRRGHGHLVCGGRIVWSRSGPVKRVIRAEADIPNRDLRMVMTIYRNDDPGLPDDPIVELVIDMPRNSDNSRRISGFELKDGEPIVGSQVIHEAGQRR